MNDGPGPAPPSGESDRALSVSFRLTAAFLRRHPHYRQRLSLTPEHARFDPVLWRSSVATMRGLLRAVAEQEELAVGEEDLETAVQNLVEGVVLRARDWAG